MRLCIEDMPISVFPEIMSGNTGSGIPLKDIHFRFHEHLTESIIILSSNISSRKCHVMKLVQCSTSLDYSKSAFSVISPKIELPHNIYCTTSLSLFKRKMYVHFK